MKISVIIPVYKAEKYIRKAVESALEQEETGEALLVEDKSPDNSLQICRQLATEFDTVRLLQHPDKKNHGAGASRNLGIKNARYDYIAFLDADDYYLPGRFKRAKEIFENNTHANGVYEAVGIHFYSGEGKKKWRARGGSDLTTIRHQVEAENLFEGLLIKGNNIHLNGLTLRKEIFTYSGYFLEELRLHQDTAMLFQLSVFATMVPGDLVSEVAKRGIHDENRITSNFDKIHNKYLFWKNLFMWAYGNKIDKSRLQILYKLYLYASYRVARNKNSQLSRLFFLGKTFSSAFISHPVLFFHAVRLLMFNKFLKSEG